MGQLHRVFLGKGAEMTITLYKKDSASGTVYDSSVIESLSATQNADIMADIVPIDTAICRIRSETPLVAEYMDVDDNTGITGRPLSPLVAPIGHYVVKQINNLGNNLYEIQGYSLVYRLDTPKVPAKYYNGVSLAVALKDVEKNANGSFGVTYNVDTALSGKTITGYCPEQTARERLQQLCWAVGGYVSCACSALINILTIPSTAQGTVPKSEIYAFPTVANEDEVARINLTVHTYTAGTSGDDIVVDADGNKYVHTTSTLTMANTALTGVSNREISVDNATLVNSSNAQATLLRMASVYFNSGTWYGTTTPQGYIPGQMVQAEDRDGQKRQGYISALTYSFGKGAATTMELKQSVSISGLPAPVLSVTSTNETLWITSSDDRVTSFMLYDNDTLIHTFTQLSTPTASITNGTMSWNSITNADGYIVNAVKDGETQSKSVTETSINLSAWLTEAGTYSLTVKASGYGYIMSDESAAVAYTKQDTIQPPVITLSGSVISWAAVSNATAYRIIATADTAKQTDTTSTSFDLSTWSDLTAGTWTIRVLSTNGTVYSDSSNTVTYIIQNKLATPTIAIEGDTLKITDVENAQKYKIYANGELKTTIPKAVQPFTLTLNYKSDTGQFRYGRVKIGSAPTSDNDYDYQAVSTHIENKAGSNLGTTVTVNNVLKYYSWATNPTSGLTNWQTPVEHTEQSYDLRYITCLTGDTLVTMADNNVKRLDAIEVGDYVLSFDFDNKILIPRKVIYTDKNEMKSHTEYDKWTFEDGTEIKTVHRHEFYNLEAQRMKYMDEWSVGEHTYKIDGTMPKLISHKIVEETVRHYKITLEGSTNYFANGLLTGDRYCPESIVFNTSMITKESDK